MATSAGWAQLGSTIAGGNALTKSLAYDQGEALGARTQDALAQARSRIDENNARANIADKLGSLPPDLRDVVVGAIQAHVDPAQITNAQKTSQEVGFRNQIVDPNTSDTDVARRAFALNQKGPVQQIGEGQVINELHPVDAAGAPAVVPTAIGTAIAGQHNAAAQNQLAEAGLHKLQTTNPEKFRILPPTANGSGAAANGSQPIENETTAQLVAAGQMAPPAAGTKAYLMLGGDGFMKRVNYIAGQPSGAAGGASPTQPVGASAAPGAPPTAAAPQPFQANFDGNRFAVNRTTANDFARSTGTGGKLDSVNRIAGHLGVLEDLYNNLNNTNYVPANELKNIFQNLTGKQYPGSTQVAAQMIGTEAIKSMTNVGAGGVDERENLSKAFGPNGTPEGQKTAISTIQALVAEQAKDLAMRGARGGLKGVYTPGQYFSPEAIQRYGLVDPKVAPPAAAVAAPVVGGGGPQSFKTEAEAEAAGLKSGTKVIIGGVPGTWQ